MIKAIIIFFIITMVFSYTVIHYDKQFKKIKTEMVKQEEKIKDQIKKD